MIVLPLLVVHLLKETSFPMCFWSRHYLSHGARIGGTHYSLSVMCTNETILRNQSSVRVSRNIHIHTLLLSGIPTVLTQVNRLEGARCWQWNKLHRCRTLAHVPDRLLIDRSVPTHPQHWRRLASQFDLLCHLLTLHSFPSMSLF